MICDCLRLCVGGWGLSDWLSEWIKSEFGSVHTISQTDYGTFDSNSTDCVPTVKWIESFSSPILVIVKYWMYRFGTRIWHKDSFHILLFYSALSCLRCTRKFIVIPESIAGKGTTIPRIGIYESNWIEDPLLHIVTIDSWVQLLWQHPKSRYNNVE